MTDINRKQRPAIEGGDPVRKEFLPFFRPSINEGDVDSVTEALRSGWLTLGPQTEKFEQELKHYIGARNVVAVNSCSAAMFLALKALGVGPGDEVITSSLTFASTVHGIIHAGARPILADIEPETFGPAPAEFERLTTDRTKVYLPVHFGGQACHIDRICAIAKAKGIHIVEDAAHSFGASFDGKMVGTIGDATAFSFYATKNLTCGEGGALSTNNDDISNTTRSLVYHGMSHDSWARYTEKGSWYYEVDYPGYKYNMSDILSSLGRSQLRRMDTLLATRRAVAERFITLLADSPYFEMPETREGNHHTWHLFVVRLKQENLTIDRDHFVKALAAENIGYSVHFIPIHKHPFFEPYLGPDHRYPVCDDYFARCISLPIFPDMRGEDVEDVVHALNRIATYYAKT